MSTRNILNLVLLAVVGILVLFVIYEPGKQEKVKQTLSRLDKNTVNKITITRTGVKDVVLVKQGDNWRMQAPYELAANNFKAENLLDLLGLESDVQYPLDKLDVKTYGLDKPRASITYNDKHRFEFGTTEPLKRRRYIKHNNTLYVVADIFYHRMSLNETDYLDHSILPGNKPINKLVLPAFTLSLHNGSWRMKPEPKSYSNDQANELIENWKLSQAISIRKFTGKPGKQKARVFLEGPDKPMDFYITSNDKGFYLARPDLGLEYEFATDKRKELLELPPKVEVELPATKTNNKPATGPAAGQ